MQPALWTLCVTIACAAIPLALGSQGERVERRQDELSVNDARQFDVTNFPQQNVAENDMVDVAGSGGTWDLEGNTEVGIADQNEEEDEAEVAMMMAEAIARHQHANTTANVMEEEEELDEHDSDSTCK